MKKNQIKPCKNKQKMIIYIKIKESVRFMKKNNGITLIALIITIVVTTILISVNVISIKGPKGVSKEVKNNSKIFELQEVQQAVLETYLKYKQTDNEEYLIGIQCDDSDIDNYAGEQKGLLKDSTYSNYYVLNSEESLEKIGIKSANDYYIVNYKTGEVLNYTTKKISDGTVLYSSGRE